jgi:phosphoserine phosphatase
MSGVRQAFNTDRPGAAMRVIAFLFVVFLGGMARAGEDPLPSWNETPARAAIIAFVEAVSTTSSPDFVVPEERIAVFDNDGTLWVEQPIYTQFAFAMDRVKTLAPAHPEWANEQPFKAVLENDFAALADAGLQGAVQLIMATHAGTTVDEFAALVTQWLATARHPRFQRPYRDLSYKPMLELLVYLRDHGFKTYIVSGGGIEFMRPWTQSVYGVPPEQVIGSSIVTRFEIQDGVPVLVRLPEVEFVDDKAGKPLGINKFIGRRPIAAFGNSDGDLEMLQWATFDPGGASA